jgi:hypothetical protein
MRSSKSRSRNKNNRRPSGNIVNRVFDSSGPEGKVRGTPQQIIDKYTQLARDAQLAGDRVAVENFQQHAEHYTRMLGEAMQEQQRQQGADGTGNGGGNGGQGTPQQGQSGQPQGGQMPQRGEARSSGPGPLDDPQDDATPDTADLVETPETEADTPAPQPERKPRRPRKPRAPRADRGEGGGDDAASGDAPAASAAE